MCNDMNNANEKQTACGSKLHNSMKVETQQFIETCNTLEHFMGAQQKAVLAEVLEGEESAFFVKLLGELAGAVNNTPLTYSQEDLGDQAVVHLHYFVGCCDWFISERDSEEEQLQAFGLADLGMGYPELGYINLREILAAGAELDFYWTPTTIGAIRAMRSKRGL